MKKFTCSLFFFTFGIIAGCEAGNVTSMNEINSENVEHCDFDYDISNYYCKPENLKIYSDYIGKPINFNKEYTVIRIKDGGFYRAVVLNQRNKHIYPLNYQFGKSSIFSHSQQESDLCIQGDFYGYRDTYENSKICFKMIEGSFVKSSIDELISKNSGAFDKIKFIKIPTHSNVYGECFSHNSEKYCHDWNYGNFYLYSLKEAKDISATMEAALKNEKIQQINLDGIRFIPQVSSKLYGIAEHYIDTDVEDKTLYYLIQFSEPLSVTFIGENYDINPQRMLYYKGSNGLKKSVKLD